MVKKALCVGCNYPSKAFGLSGAVNDAFLLAECLQLYCGFDAANVSVLHDIYPGQPKSHKVEPGLLPTRFNILQKMQWLVRNTQPGDSLFFSFSGYGAQVEDINCPSGSGYDEAILPTDFVEGRDDDYAVIVASDIHDVLTGVPSYCSVTVLMDCDHATSVVDVAGTLDGELVTGLQLGSVCGLMRMHNGSKVRLATHDQDVWREEGARSAKARPRFQPMIQIDDPRRGRLPTRTGMSSSSPVAFCFSAARFGQTALEVQVTREIDGKLVSKQHGVLTWCFVRALLELKCDCTYLALFEGVLAKMRQLKKESLPQLDQEVLLTFAKPASNPVRMKALRGSGLLPAPSPAATDVMLEQLVALAAEVSVAKSPPMEWRDSPTEEGWPLVQPAKSSPCGPLLLHSHGRRSISPAPKKELPLVQPVRSGPCVPSMPPEMERCLQFPDSSKPLSQLLGKEGLMTSATVQLGSCGLPNPMAL